MTLFCFNLIVINFVINLLYSFYDTLLIYAVFKIVKWLHTYFKTFAIINKINGPKPILFIGNAHKLKKKYGKFYYYHDRERFYSSDAISIH